MICSRFATLLFLLSGRAWALSVMTLAASDDCARLDANRSGSEFWRLDDEGKVSGTQSSAYNPHYTMLSLTPSSFCPNQGNVSQWYLEIDVQVPPEVRCLMSSELRLSASKSGRIPAMAKWFNLCFFTTASVHSSTTAVFRVTYSALNRPFGEKQFHESHDFALMTLPSLSAAELHGGHWFRFPDHAARCTGGTCSATLETGSSYHFSRWGNGNSTGKLPVLTNDMSFTKDNAFDAAVFQTRSLAIPGMAIVGARRAGTGNSPMVDGFRDGLSVRSFHGLSTKVPSNQQVFADSIEVLFDYEASLIPRDMKSIEVVFQYNTIKLDGEQQVAKGVLEFTNLKGSMVPEPKSKCSGFSIAFVTLLGFGVLLSGSM